MRNCNALVMFSMKWLVTNCNTTSMIGREIFARCISANQSIVFSLVCKASDKWRTEGQTVNKYYRTGHFRRIVTFKREIAESWEYCVKIKRK